MNKDTLINLRTTTELKDAFQAVVEKEGFTMSEVLEGFMVDVANKNFVPINIRSKIVRKRPSMPSIPYIKKCVDEILFNMNNPSIRSVSLFGSYSKGTAKPSSDIDLFLEFDEGFNLLDLATLQVKLETSLGKKVDLVTQCENERFRDAILRERIQLYERRA